MKLHRLTATAVAVGSLCACGAQLEPTTPGASLSPSAVPTTIADSDILAFVRGDDIWLARADGTGEHQLTTHGGVANGLAWSPDGQSIAYIRDDHLWVIDVRGNERVISDSVNISYPSWSPDGSRVVANGRNGMVIIDISDGAVTSLAASTTCYGSPDWGPNSDLIVFTGSDQCEGGQPTALYLVEPDGTNERILRGFDAESNSASWSPDGTLMALQSDLDGGCLYVMNADGTNLRRLTTGCMDGFSINWSADGSQLVGSGGAHGPDRGFIVDLDGTQKTDLSALGSISSLDWRPQP